MSATAEKRVYLASKKVKSKQSEEEQPGESGKLDAVINFLTLYVPSVAVFKLYFISRRSYEGIY